MVASSSEFRTLFAAFDRDADGKISAAELQGIRILKKVTSFLSKFQAVLSSKLHAVRELVEAVGDGHRAGGAGRPLGGAEHHRGRWRPRHGGRRRLRRLEPGDVPGPAAARVRHWRRRDRKP